MLRRIRVAFVHVLGVGIQTDFRVAPVCGSEVEELAAFRVAHARDSAADIFTLTSESIIYLFIALHTKLKRRSKRIRRVAPEE